MPPAKVAYLTGRTFFSSLISTPFMGGLHVAFDFAVAACLVAGVASWLRGGKFHYEESEAAFAATSPRTPSNLPRPAAGGHLPQAEKSPSRRR